MACPPSFDPTLSSSLSSSSSSSRALTYYVVAITTSLDAPSLLSFSLRHHLYRHFCHHYHRDNACLIAPLSCQRLVVASSTLSPRQRLSCRAGAFLVAPSPLLLRCPLSCGASLPPAGCRFVNYLDVSPSLLSCWLVVALLPLSLRPSLSLRHLSHCVPVSLGHRPSTPVKSVSVCSGGLPLSIGSSGTGQKASCGALKGNFRRRRPWW